MGWWPSSLRSRMDSRRNATAVFNTELTQCPESSGPRCCSRSPIFWTSSAAFAGNWRVVWNPAKPHIVERAFLVPDDLHQRPLPPPSVEFAIENLLPGTKIESPFGDGHDHLAPHHLSFEVSVGIVFTSPVVLVVGSRCMRGQFLEPYLVVVQEPFFGIIDKHRGCYVHCIHKAEAFLDSTFPYEFLDGLSDIDEPASVRNFKPQVLG